MAASLLPPKDSLIPLALVGDSEKNTDGALFALARSVGAKTWGPVPLDRVRITIVEGMRSYPAEVKLRAEEHWKAVLRVSPHLFEGPVWCLRSVTEPFCCPQASHRDDDVVVELELQRSSFKYVLYTHLSTDALLLPEAHRAGAIGVSAMTATADGYLVLGRRSEMLACLPGHWHFAPAGQLDSASVQAVLEKELHEELGCTWGDVADSRLLALMDSGAEQGHKWDFICWLRLSLGASQVHALYSRAEDSYEHDGLIFVRIPGAAPLRGEVGPTLEFDEFFEQHLLSDVARRALVLFRHMLRDEAWRACFFA